MLILNKIPSEEYVVRTDVKVFVKSLKNNYNKLRIIEGNKEFCENGMCMYGSSIWNLSRGKMVALRKTWIIG